MDEYVRELDGKISRWKTRLTKDYCDCYVRLVYLESTIVSKPSTEFLKHVETDINRLNTFCCGKAKLVQETFESMCSQLRVWGSDQSHTNDKLSFFEESALLMDEEVIVLDKFIQQNTQLFGVLGRLYDEEHQTNISTWFASRIKREPFSNISFNHLFLLISDAHEYIRLAKSKTKGGATWTPPSSFERDTTKYWCPPQYLTEVKVKIMQNLPMLVIGRSTGDEIKDPEVARGHIASVYFDNPNKDVYRTRLDRLEGATLLRYRWYGHNDGSGSKDVYIERKTHHECWVQEKSVKERLPIRQRDVLGFTNLEFSISKKPDRIIRGKASDKDFQKMIALGTEIQDIELGKRGQKPALRTDYWRSAFQLATSNDVRISIDEELLMINEQVPLGPGEWCRSLAHNSRVAEEDVYQFPYAVLEVKLATSNPPPWILDLTENGYLVKAEKFSKFTQGSATLHYEQIDKLPYWWEFLRAYAELEKDPFRRLDFDVWKPELRDEPPPSKLGFKSKAKTADSGVEGVINTPVAKFEPKSHFANERVMLLWVNNAVLCAVSAISLMLIGGDAEVVAVSLAPVILIVLIYALYQFYSRGQVIATFKKTKKRVDDARGPYLLTGLMILTFGVILGFSFPAYLLPEVIDVPGRVDDSYWTTSFVCSDNIADSFLPLLGGTEGATSSAVVSVTSGVMTILSSTLYTLSEADKRSIHQVWPSEHESDDLSKISFEKATAMNGELPLDWLDDIDASEALTIAMSRYSVSRQLARNVTMVQHEWQLEFEGAQRRHLGTLQIRAPRREALLDLYDSINALSSCQAASVPRLFIDMISGETGDTSGGGTTVVDESSVVRITISRPDAEEILQDDVSLASFEEDFKLDMVELLEDVYPGVSADNIVVTSVTRGSLIVDWKLVGLDDLVTEGSEAYPDVSSVVCAQVDVAVRRRLLTQSRRRLARSFSLDEITCQSPVRINEVSRDGEWIELYNPNVSEIMLGGYQLSDSADNTFTFAFPSILESGARVVVEYASTPNLGFRLGSSDSVTLVSNSGVVLDSVSWTNAQHDCRGRIPDGEGSFEPSSCTKGDENERFVSDGGDDEAGTCNFLINEVFRSVAQGVSWIEFVNPHLDCSSPVFGWRVVGGVDDYSTRVFLLPGNSTLAPQQRIVFSRDDGLFQIASSDSIRLVDPDGNVIEKVEVKLGAPKDDMSFARIPDSSGNFQTTHPTENESNKVSSDSGDDGCLQSILINEARRIGASYGGSYVELYNPNAECSIDVQSYELVDNHGNRQKIVGSRVVGAEDYLVLDGDNLGGLDVDRNATLSLISKEGLPLSDLQWDVSIVDNFFVLQSIGLMNGATVAMTPSPGEVNRVPSIRGPMECDPVVALGRVCPLGEGGILIDVVDVNTECEVDLAWWTVGAGSEEFVLPFDSIISPDEQTLQIAVMWEYEGLLGEALSLNSVNGTVDVVSLPKSLPRPLCWGLIDSQWGVVWPDGDASVVVPTLDLVLTDIEGGVSSVGSNCTGSESLLINEIVASPTIEVPEDTVELHLKPPSDNSTTTAGVCEIDMSGMTLTDDNGNSYTFPEASVLSSGDYVVVSKAQLGFGLSRAGGSVTLATVLGTVMDIVIFESIPSGASWGRLTDPPLNGSFALTLPSPSEANVVLPTFPDCWEGVVMTEVTVFPVVSYSSAGIEITNTNTACLVNLAGWFLQFDDSGHTFDEGALLNPLARIVVTEVDLDVTLDYDDVEEHALSLFLPNGVLADVLEWDGLVHYATESYGRLDDDQWDRATPSLGAANSPSELSWSDMPCDLPIIFTEIMMEEGDQWVELYNPNDSCEVDLTSWIVTDGFKSVALPQTTIGSQTFFIVTPEMLLQETSAGLNLRNGRRLSLNSPSHQVLDSVVMQSVEDGMSYSRLPSYYSSGKAWVESKPSKATANFAHAPTMAPICGLTTMISEVGIDHAEGEFIEIYIPEDLCELAIGGWVLVSGGSEYTIPAGSMVSGQNYLTIWEDEYDFDIKGEEVSLQLPDGTVVDLVDVPDLDKGTTYARIPSPDGEFEVLDMPTPDEENIGGFVSLPCSLGFGYTTVAGSCRCNDGHYGDSCQDRVPPDMTDTHDYGTEQSPTVYTLSITAELVDELEDVVEDVTLDADLAEGEERPQTDVVVTSESPALGGEGNDVNGVLSHYGVFYRSEEHPSWKIELDGEEWLGMTTLLLYSLAGDPSKVKAKLAYDLLGQVDGMVSRRTEFVHVTLNGEDRGLHLLVEHLDADWLVSHGVDEDAFLYESRSEFWVQHEDLLNVEDDDYSLFDFSQLFKPITRGDDHTNLINSIAAFAADDSADILQRLNINSFIRFTMFSLLIGLTGIGPENILLLSTSLTSSGIYTFLLEFPTTSWGDGDNRYYEHLVSNNPRLSKWAELGLWKTLLLAETQGMKALMEVEAQSLVAGPLHPDNISQLLSNYETALWPHLRQSEDVWDLHYDAESYPDAWLWRLKDVPLTNYQVMMAEGESPMSFTLHEVNHGFDDPPDSLTFVWDEAVDIGRDSVTYELVFSTEEDFSDVFCTSSAEDTEAVDGVVYYEIPEDDNCAFENAETYYWVVFAHDTGEDEAHHWVDPPAARSFVFEGDNVNPSGDTVVNSDTPVWRHLDTLTRSLTSYVSPELGESFIRDGAFEGYDTPISWVPLTFGEEDVLISETGNGNVLHVAGRDGESTGVTQAVYTGFVDEVVLTVSLDVFVIEPAGIADVEVVVVARRADGGGDEETSVSVDLAAIGWHVMTVETDPVVAELVVVKIVVTADSDGGLVAVDNVKLTPSVE